MRNGSRLHALGVFLAIGSIALLGSARAYEVFHGPTELIYSDPEKAAPGYLLLPSWPRIERYEYIYLINLEGEVVHMWKTVPPEYEGQGYILEKTARLTEKGSIVVGPAPTRTATRASASCRNWTGAATSSGRSAIPGRAISTTTTSSGSGTTISTTGPSSSRPNSR